MLIPGLPKFGTVMRTKTGQSVFIKVMVLGWLKGNWKATVLVLDSDTDGHWPIGKQRTIDIDDLDRFEIME